MCSAPDFSDALTQIGSKTVSSILSFFLIIAQNPAIQHRAQEEVDTVTCEQGRPPKCCDRQHMPYLDAVLKEVYRCNPVLPLGEGREAQTLYNQMLLTCRSQALPHYLRCEDVYAGYCIPAGSTVFGNTW